MPHQQLKVWVYQNDSRSRPPLDILVFASKDVAIRCVMDICDDKCSENLNDAALKMMAELAIEEHTLIEEY